jgi:hypothetical protein
MGWPIFNALLKLAQRSDSTPITVILFGVGLRLKIVYH